MRWIVATLLTFAAAPGLAEDMSLIVDRSERGVEFFIKLPTSQTETLLAPFPVGFLGSDGLVDIGPFRDGTADHGDALWASVRTRLSGEIAPVEAMSMMVHPDALPVEFQDPIDGWIAMAVCNVTDPDARFDVSELSTYVGYNAWDVEGHGPLEIAFPANAEIDVVEFLEGREISRATMRVSPDRPLTLDAVTTWEKWRFW